MLTFLILYLFVIPLGVSILVLPFLQGRPRQVKPWPRPGTPEHARMMADVKKGPG